MTTKNDNPDREWQTEQDSIDRVLDAALAKYATVEPRDGFEKRILAHLQTAPEPQKSAWRWSATVACAVAIVILVAVAWRWSGKPAPVVAHDSPGAVQNTPRGPQITSNVGGRATIRPTLKPVSKHFAASPRASHKAYPKLDQFPSRQPMSDQEAALIRYVKEFPHEAVLIAQAQDEYEKELEKRKEAERAENERFSSNRQER
jgi:hypothetical protein